MAPGAGQPEVARHAERNRGSEQINADDELAGLESAVSRRRAAGFGILRVRGFGGERRAEAGLGHGRDQLFGRDGRRARYSTAALSAAKFTAAWTTPGTFLFSVRSIVAEQLAQLMPVIAEVDPLAVGTA